MAKGADSDAACSPGATTPPSTSCRPAMPSTRSPTTPARCSPVPPLVPPPGVLNHLTIAAFNELWYRKAPRRADRADRVDPRLLPPARRVGSWNRLYGRRGSCSTSSSCRSARRPRCARWSSAWRRRARRASSPCSSASAPANPAPLSFPDPRLDAGPRHPGGGHGLARCCTGSTTSCSTPAGATTSPRTPTRRPAAIRRGYPRLDEWRAVRAAVDPTGVWASDQSRRLRLLED